MNSFIIYPYGILFAVEDISLSLWKVYSGEKCNKLAEYKYNGKFQSITLLCQTGFNQMDWLIHGLLFIVWLTLVCLRTSSLLMICSAFHAHLFSLLLSLLQCNNDYAPVCGSNNQNYQNECFLRRDACKQQSEVLIMSEGACPAGMWIFICCLHFDTHTCRGAHVLSLPSSTHWKTQKKLKLNCPAWLTANILETFIKFNLKHYSWKYIQMLTVKRSEELNQGWFTSKE